MDSDTAHNLTVRASSSSRSNPAMAMGSYTHLSDVLHILLQHLEPSTALVCSVAQVCNSWRTVTQDLRRQLRGRLDVILEASEHPRPEAWDDTIRSFRTWLGMHADLVRSITVSKGKGEDAEIVARFLTAQETLAAALQECQACNSTASSTGDAASQGKLQLQAYSSDCMGSSVILQSLWSSHITSLHLSLPQHSRSDPSLPSSQHLLSAFKRLGKLQSLSLSFKLQQALSEACCKGLGLLTSLTALDLGVGLNAGTRMALQLPEMLPSLPLQRLRLCCTYEDANPEWDLSSFTQLTDLEFKFTPYTTEEGPRSLLQLPAQVRVLNILCDGLDVYSEQGNVPPVLNYLTALRQLESVSTSTACALPDYAIKHLTKLSTLQHISLSYGCADAARANQKDWVHMKHLKQLRVDLYSKHIDYRPVSCSELHELLGSIGCLTTLTTLKLNLNPYPFDYTPTYNMVDLYDGYPLWIDDYLDQLPNPQLDGAGNDSTSSPQPSSPRPSSSNDETLPLDVFKHLTGLEHLQELQVSRSSKQPHAYDRGLFSSGLSKKQWPALLEGSAQQLPALTALTSLQLYNLGSAVGDASGLAVAASLRRLRHLTLCDCDISSTATKAALKRLPMLTELVFSSEEVYEEGDSEDDEDLDGGIDSGGDEEDSEDSDDGDGSSGEGA